MVSPALISCLLMVGMCYVNAQDEECVVENFVIQGDFDITRFVGTWYEKYYLHPYFRRAKAPWQNYYETYTLGSDGTSLNVVQHGWKDGTCRLGQTQYFWSPQEPAKLASIVKVNDTTSFPLDYWVLATDYEQYAVFYGCDINKEDGSCEQSHAIVLSRSRDPFDQFLKFIITESLKTVCISPNNLLVNLFDRELCP